MCTKASTGIARKNAKKIKPSAPKFHTQKKDVDNLAKFILDALNGIFWSDDKIVIKMIAEKFWVNQGQAKTIIEIYKI